MIEFFHVSKRYGENIQALRDINFKIAQGEFVFVTGPSGAGKTTLIKLILGMEDITEGEVIILDKNIRRLKRKSIPYLRRNIGVVFQDFKLINSRNVFDNVAIALEILGLPYREIKKRVKQVLEQLGIERYAKSYPMMLSGGEQQRVAIARAIVNDPQIIIADEPTGNLDPDLSIEIMKMFYEFNKKGSTVIIATHDKFLLEHFSVRVMLLNRGFLVQDTKNV